MLTIFLPLNTDSPNEEKPNVPYSAYSTYFCKPNLGQK